MSESEVEVLYECFVCGKAFSKVQALRGHMRIHKGHGFVRTTIWANDERWRAFRALCRKHKTTTCHLLDVLLRAALKGDETGMIDIGSSNPLIINLNSYFLAGPRSRYKIPFDPSRVAHDVQPVHCPVCGSKRVRQFKAVDGVLEGSCLCGATWLIRPAAKEVKG